MRWVLACAAVFGILWQPDRGAAAEPAEAVGQCPIARLQSLGFPFEYTRFEHPTGVTDPNEVEYIRLGKVDSRSSEPPSLPEEVFDIFPEFPKLRKIHLEYFLVDSENLKRLQEVRHLNELSIHISRGTERKSFAKPEDLDFLAELPGLERLGLTSSDLTDDMIVKLLPLVSVKRLHLS